MEIKLFKSYCELTTIVQESIANAIEDTEDIVYIKGLDNCKTGHIIDVFTDSCNFLGLEPILEIDIPIQDITPIKICGIVMWYNAEVNSMTLTIS